MAHEIENMMYVGDRPWHGLGVKLPNAPTIGEGIQSAGLAWTVSKQNLYLGDGRKTEFFATVRESDKSILGYVGPDYTVLQNADAFAWFDPFLQSGLATLETAMSLRGGSRVAILAKIASDPIVIVSKSNDAIERYILLSNGHDGKLACRVGFTPVRVVCHNTLTMAHRSGASKLLRVKHHANVKENINEIREIMNVANSEFEATADQFRSLAAKEINYADLKKYIKKVFRQTPEDALETTPAIEFVDATDPETRKGETLCNRILPLFDSGRGNDLPGVKNTYWAAYNAITEYLSYERGRTQDVRLDSLYYGQAATFNQRALNVALDMAK